MRGGAIVFPGAELVICMADDLEDSGRREQGVGILGGGDGGRGISEEEGGIELWRFCLISYWIWKIVIPSWGPPHGEGCTH